MWRPIDLKDSTNKILKKSNPFNTLPSREHEQSHGELNEHGHAIHSSKTSQLLFTTLFSPTDIIIVVVQESFPIIIPKYLHTRLPCQLTLGPSSILKKEPNLLLPYFAFVFMGSGPVQRTSSLNKELVAEFDSSLWLVPFTGWWAFIYREWRWKVWKKEKWS